MNRDPDRRQLSPALYALAALCSALVAAGILIACTHDYGQFESGSEAPFDAGYDAGIDAACNPDPACTNNAKKCAADCAATEKTCEDNCGGGGGTCRRNCQDAGVGCAQECAGYCLTCAGCNARTACENAVQ